MDVEANDAGSKASIGHYSASRIKGSRVRQRYAISKTTKIPLVVDVPRLRVCCINTPRLLEHLESNLKP